MSRYLLSVYQPDGPKPPPAALHAIMEKVDALRAEMKEAGVLVLTATVVTEHPPKVVTKREVDASMASPAVAAPAAPAPAATAGASASAPHAHTNAARSSAAEGGAAAETPHKKLPKTASPFPAIGALGALLCGFALMLGVIRRRLA